MRTFKISGKFQEKGQYSQRKEDFSGFFVLEDHTHEIKGYMEEKYDTEYSPIRYIYGKYMEKEKRLLYLKMAEELELSPLIYIFNNIEEEGVWDSFCIFNGFFAGGQSEGLAKVKISEIKDYTKTKETQERYSEFLENVNSINNILIEFGVEEYLNVKY